ncbi:MAG TPA: alpha/beta fold hydrolase [Chloroflexota bacterium]|nr:alpha/beta fold hydrolase [Chloroflexota bacterium]
MPISEINGCRIWYELNGTGDYLIQIGGAVSGHEGYAAVTEAMAQHFTVIDYDHRGYGLSDRPHQRYSMAVWADDMVALLDTLGVEQAHVHGGSMGGFIAVYFAVKYPARVKRLVIGGGAARCDQMARMHFSLWKSIARAYGIDSDELATELCTKAFSRRYLDEQGSTLVREMREVTARNASLEVFCSACDAMIETDVRDQLGNISAPTLIMVGDEDCLTPLNQGPGGAGAQTMHDLIPHSELCVLPRCGHGNLVERPRESIDAILAFLLR